MQFKEGDFGFGEEGGDVGVVPGGLEFAEDVLEIAVGHFEEFVGCGLERVDSGGDGKVALETRSLLALVCST